ncbi:MAG TPA: serine/threonine-protein kinase [Kofleriaceae bacterium]|nr:serine/threonine-protein kinase [Kofleriaceae bacterium]
MANSPARATVDVGSVIADTYTVEALIGRGGMGSVFRASHKRLPGKQVAIKVLHAELIEDEVLARFRREAEIASRLGHPNIVAVHDFNVTPDGTPYLVLELLHGESLAQRLRGGPLPLEQVLSIVRQVGSALAAAHREGIVHRDLKPQNIFLVPTEVDGRHVEIAKVLDFGISKMRGSATVKTQESMLLGTPQYMAPEQAKGEHDKVDERTDVFALGAIVYEMLCGHPAFSGASIPEVCFKVVYEPPAELAREAPTVPPGVVDAVTQAMAKPQSDRFFTVSAFVEALTGQPVSQFQMPVARSTLDGIPASPTPRVTSQEAFAKTMGSGSGPPADDATRSLRPVDAPRPVSPQARTVETQTPAKGVPVVQEPAPPPPRSRLVWIALAIVGLGAIAAVVYVMTRDHHERPTPIAAVTPDAAPPIAADAAVVVTPDATVVVEVIDAGAPVDAAVIAAKKPDDKKKPPKPPTPPPDEDDDGADPGQLSEARAALRAGNFEQAEKLARMIINAESASPRQRAQAHSLHGVIQCRFRNNEERALIDLRNIPPTFRNARATLMRACNAAGFLRNAIE